ncbi:hypothetical protein QYF36_018290 [Acer negundo]|nr:hypothetical protein QYF36_018290 [Acer negundo]
MVADNESGKSLESKVRTSSGMFLSKTQGVVACIVYKYKTGVRAVCHFAHYARAAFATAATCEKGLVKTVANEMEFSSFSTGTEHAVKTWQGSMNGAVVASVTEISEMQKRVIKEGVTEVEVSQHRVQTQC